ncbi:MAG: DNA alkylation repair protein [Acidobacteria bacterium]|nr:DNA alkylation repair protein [Acidobacteriota bacterium]
MSYELRDFYDDSVIADIARDLKGAYPSFNERAFRKECLDGLAPLSLTGRAAHIAAAMRRHLPADFDEVADILERSLGSPHAGTDSFGMAPFKYLPHTMVVASDGLGHFEASMRLQYELTQRFTAEFSIRAFLNTHPDATYTRLVEWSTDPNAHVRRLVSEGSRPRLPWAPRLRHFQQDPTPVLALLERLKDDPDLYVRRSVANSLNDVAKDHPDLVVDVCRRWLTGASPERRWIVAHALRSLVKAGHPGALELLGAGAKPKVTLAGVRIAPKRVTIGGRVECTLSVVSTARASQDLLIDYVVHYVKADGRTSPKVFKLKRITLGRGEAAALRFTVKLADLTTRRHYPGRHSVSLRINGKDFPLGSLTVSASR